MLLPQSDFILYKAEGGGPMIGEVCGIPCYSSSNINCSSKNIQLWEIKIGHLLNRVVPSSIKSWTEST